LILALPRYCVRLRFAACQHAHNQPVSVHDDFRDMVTNDLKGDFNSAYGWDHLKVFLDRLSDKLIDFGCGDAEHRSRLGLLPLGHNPRLVEAVQNPTLLRQPNRSRIWQSDGFCIRLRAEWPNHVWSYDFVADRTREGRKYRMLNVLDEFTLEFLAIRVDRKLMSTDVIDVLSNLFILRPRPFIRNRGSPSPLGHRLRIDAVTLRKRPQALLTMLYRSTDRLSRRGAPVKNLAHSASFHCMENIAPSNPGIKHLHHRKSHFRSQLHQC
jgi:hypothetical protein